MGLDAIGMHKELYAGSRDLAAARVQKGAKPKELTGQQDHGIPENMQACGQIRLGGW
jgi:hypothetical protein